MLTVIESQIAFNWADDNGGGIYNKGELTVVHCILNNNLSGNTGLAMPGKGGAIYTSGTGTYELDGIVSIDSSTFDNNVSGAGGAIYAGDTAFAPIVRNSTFTNNNAFEHGGAIYDMPIISIINSTIALNGAGGGAQAGGGIYTLRTELTSTIIANSRLVSINAPNVDQITISVLDSSDNCAGPITNGGNNIQYPGTSCGSSIPSLDPYLFPALQQNSAPTTYPKTLAIHANSPAVDAGNNFECSNQLQNLDARGFPRPVDGNSGRGLICDIGAYEYRPDQDQP